MEENQNQESGKKKLEQQEIYMLFFSKKEEQLSQLSKIYEDAIKEKNFDTLKVFFPLKSNDNDNDIGSYPEQVEVLKNGNVATVLDKNMNEDEKNKYMEALKKFSELNIFHSDNLEKFIKYAQRKEVKAGLGQHNFTSQEMKYFYINCDVDKSLELLDGFKKESIPSLTDEFENVENNEQMQNDEIPDLTPNQEKRDNEL